MKNLFTLLAIVLTPFVSNAQLTAENFSFEVDTTETTVSYEYTDITLFARLVGYDPETMPPLNCVVGLLYQIDQVSQNNWQETSIGVFEATDSSAYLTISDPIYYGPQQFIRFKMRVDLMDPNNGDVLANLHPDSIYTIYVDDFVTSVPDQEIITFDLSPNPVTDGNVMITTSSQSANIYDMTGKIVKSIPTNIPSFVGDLPAGIYFVHADEASTPVKRLVIQ